MTLPKDSRNTRCWSAGPIASSAADIRPTADPADRSSTHAHAANGATTLLIGTSPTCTQLWAAPRSIRKTAAFGSTVRHRSGPTALRDLRPPAARHCRADGSAPGGRRRSPDLRTDADLPRRGRTTEAESLIARPRRPSPRPWPVTPTPLAGTRSAGKQTRLSGLSGDPSKRKTCLIVHGRWPYRQAFRSGSHEFAAARSASIPYFQ